MLMAKKSVYCLFPTDKINELATWRFVLHFKIPCLFCKKKTRKAVQSLKDAEWKIIDFACNLDDIHYEPGKDTVDIPIVVPEERRSQPNSLADYESDVWKVYGIMLKHGFGDLYYEAVDWQEEE